jgi:hypothetical protein
MSRHPSLIETDFAPLSDGTLLELVENPSNPGRYCLSVWRGGEIQFVDEFEHDGQVSVPPRDSKIRTPRGSHQLAASYGIDRSGDSSLGNDQLERTLCKAWVG